MSVLTITPAITTTRTATFTLNGRSLSVDLFDSAAPKSMSVVTDDGGTVRVGWLDHDPYAVWDWNDTTFAEFTTEWDRDTFADQMRAEVGPERVFIVDHYDHGAQHYSLTGTIPYHHGDWDARPSCVLALTADVHANDANEHARTLLDRYSAWGAGECFIATAATVSDDGAMFDIERKAGLIGTAAATATLNDMLTR